jgi:hypothetical protein
LSAALGFFLVAVAMCGFPPLFTRLANVWARGLIK